MVELIKDALISDCGRFRYYLLRQWATYRPLLVFVLLNPSKADAFVDDRTLAKCMAFAYSLSYDGVLILNAYAYRATDPEDLREAGYPVGPMNDDILRAMLPGQPMVICGWGANARGKERPAEVLQIIRESGCTPHALRLLADGTPEHPLYLPSTCKPSPLITP